MTITIEVNEIAADRHRASIKVGDAETTLATCYSKADAFNDALSFLRHEYERGDYSKFALFHRGEQCAVIDESREVR